MALGFRKSLFGFNQDDVVKYVEKTHKAFTEKEIVLKEQIEDLQNELAAAKSQITEIAAENIKLEAELKEYTEKYDEMERLSQNIGKLYLVAKSNAATIMKEADTCADIAKREVEKNIASIGSAQEALTGVKESVVKTSAQFASEIDTLTQSLSEAKDRIGRHEAIKAQSEEDDRELIKVLSNE